MCQSLCQSSVFLLDLLDDPLIITTYNYHYTSSKCNNNLHCLSIIGSFPHINFIFSSIFVSKIHEFYRCLNLILYFLLILTIAECCFPFLQYCSIINTAFVVVILRTYIFQFMLHTNWNKCVGNCVRAWLPECLRVRLCVLDVCPCLATRVSTCASLCVGRMFVPGYPSVYVCVFV